MTLLSEASSTGKAVLGHGESDHLAALARLRKELSGLGPIVVAFSGGVDSALLSWVANDTLGPRMVTLATAVSASLAPAELEGCREFAQKWALNWVEVGTDELSRPEYVSNGMDRCYHCKSALMDSLEPLADARDAVVALGVNLDDLSEHRPGQIAAGERGAVFPLVLAGMTKSAVRAAAREVGLDVWDKPAAACLASRLPYGTPVTLGVLGQVAAAEAALAGLGFKDLRVRHYGDIARIEVPIDLLERVVRNRLGVVEALKQAGYRYVTLDLEGLRSGNLNEGLLAR
jgi:uncharacterized protein